MAFSTGLLGRALVFGLLLLLAPAGAFAQPFLVEGSRIRVDGLLDATGANDEQIEQLSASFRAFGNVQADTVHTAGGGEGRQTPNGTHSTVGGYGWAFANSSSAFGHGDVTVELSAPIKITNIQNMQPVQQRVLYALSRSSSLFSGSAVIFDDNTGSAASGVGELIAERGFRIVVTASSIAELRPVGWGTANYVWSAVGQPLPGQTAENPVPATRLDDTVTSITYTDQACVAPALVASEFARSDRFRFDSVVLDDYGRELPIFTEVDGASPHLFVVNGNRATTLLIPPAAAGDDPSFVVRFGPSGEFIRSVTPGVPFDFRSDSPLGSDWFILTASQPVVVPITGLTFAENGRQSTCIWSADAPLLAGDIDLDGDVDHVDAARFVEFLGRDNSTWTSGDFDHDHLTSGFDLALLQANLGRTRPSPSAGAAVAEPSSAALAMIGILGCMARVVRRFRCRSMQV